MGGRSSHHNFWRPTGHYGRFPTFLPATWVKNWYPVILIRSRKDFKLQSMSPEPRSSTSSDDLSSDLRVRPLKKGVWAKRRKAAAAGTLGFGPTFGP